MLCFVSQINDEDVSLRVNSEFQRSYLGEPLDVEFSYNRLEKRLYFYKRDAFIFCLEIVWYSCNTSVLTAFIARLTIRRCHNALDQTKLFGESKLRFWSQLYLQSHAIYSVLQEQQYKVMLYHTDIYEDEKFSTANTKLMKIYVISHCLI